MQSELCCKMPGKASARAEKQPGTRFTGTYVDSGGKPHHRCSTQPAAEHRQSAARGTLHTDDKGRVLSATGRHPWRPVHMRFYDRGARPRKIRASRASRCTFLHARFRCCAQSVAEIAVALDAQRAPNKNQKVGNMKDQSCGTLIRMEGGDTADARLRAGRSGSVDHRAATADDVARSASELSGRRQRYCRSWPCLGCVCRHRSRIIGPPRPQESTDSRPMLAFSLLSGFSGMASANGLISLLMIRGIMGVSGGLLPDKLCYHQ